MSLASIQRRAVAEIRATGGAVDYDYMYPGPGPAIDRNAEPPAPAWLRRAIGDERTSLLLVEVQREKARIV